ncbi:DMT family transporter [Marisediminicola senii]|uniref:DMT family transporter n=1 Tax=Marisediminicola senii TaxID=2711233 RepID=UPI0013ED9099|nr:DMT family transporter [Marisediminicola senii]
MDISDLTDQVVTLTPMQGLGIPVALVGAVFLALGAQFQHRGVGKVEAKLGEPTRGLSKTQLMALLTRPSWLIGTLMLGLAVVLQLVALRLAPLIVVQPLGAVALVITALVNTRVSRVKLDRLTIRAIALCVGGVALFVAFAASFAQETPITDAQLITVLVILAVVLVAAAVAFLVLRRRLRAILYIVGAGVLYGFVATLAKVVINRIVSDQFDWLTIICVIALLAGTALGAYFVQNAYASGPPDLIIAGLTVIDPLVAVGIGIVVLGEASEAPLYAVIAFVVAGVIAIYGVFELSKHHPQSRH